MIIPIKCFSCNKLIANKYEKYLELVKEKKYKNEYDRNDEEIFKKLKLKRYCCRRMVMTQNDMIEKLK